MIRVDGFNIGQNKANNDEPLVEHSREKDITKLVTGDRTLIINAD